MSKYLEKKILSSQLSTSVAVLVLALASFLAGRFLFTNSSIAESAILGLALAMCTSIVIYFLELAFKKVAKFEQGLKLENQVSDKLNKLKFNFKSSIKTRYGDLDFLVEKDGRYYGVEAKNWSGTVEYEDSTLYVNNFDYTDVLTTLLSNCAEVRDAELGKTSGKFVSPVLVFGYKAAVLIPNKTINFRGVEVKIANVKDFERFLV